MFVFGNVCTRCIDDNGAGGAVDKIDAIEGGDNNEWTSARLRHWMGAMAIRPFASERCYEAVKPVLEVSRPWK